MPDTPVWPMVEAIGAIVLPVGLSGRALLTARRSDSQRRRTWQLLTVAFAGWAVSQVFRTIGGIPNWDDSPVTTVILVVGLASPCCAIAGLALHPAIRPMERIGWIRSSLDAVTMTIVLWSSVWALPFVVRWRHHLGAPDVVVSAGYVTMDMIMVAVLLAALTCPRGNDQRRPLCLLGGLLAAFGADALRWVALTSGITPSAAVIVPMWVCAVIGIGIAATRDAIVAPRAAVRVDTGDTLGFRALLHAVIGVGSVIVIGEWIAGISLGSVPELMIAGIGLVVIVRLHLILNASRRLLARADHQRERLRWSERRDALTGLLNRTAFDALLAETPVERPRLPLTVIQFRPNRHSLFDHFSTAQADAIVVELANRIGACLGSRSSMARIADTTFSTLVEGDSSSAISLVREVMLTVEAPIHVPDLDLGIHLSLTAGLATTQTEGAEPPATQDLNRHAAIALGTVSSVPGGMALFTHDMLEQHDTRFRLREAVARTLRSDPGTVITVVFEPVIELSSGHMLGIAARAVWHHDGYPTISAGQLTALARESGLADRVDNTVLDIAIRGFAAWRRQWPDHCRQLWTTVCGETLSNAETDVLPRIIGLLADTGLPADALVLDPLDDCQYSASETDNLRRLRHAGTHFTTNDALALAESARTCARRTDQAACRSNDADYFDISPVLVDRCVDDVRARRLIQATVEFATTRAVATAARQVVSVEQHEQLRDLGVSVARGSLYGAPRNREDTETLLAAVSAGTWHTPVRREAQRRRSSEAWQELRQVVSRLPIGAFACDPKGILVMAEGALFGQLDFPPDLLDQPLIDVMGKASTHTNRQPLRGPLSQALRGAPSVTTVPTGDRWLQVHLCASRDGDHRITGVLGVAMDITHRIQAEQALRCSERRFREVFAQAPVGMIIVGSDTKIVQANPVIADMLGYAPEELVGRTISSLWHPETPSGAAEQFEALRAGAITRFHAERIYLHRDGSPVWVHATVGVLAETSGPGRFLGIVEDLRHVKQLEVELRHAQKLEAVGMLAAGIAHEINTPIQFISDNTNFLAQAYRQVTRVLDTANRLIPAAGDAAVRELTDISEDADLPWLLDQIPKAASHSLEGTAQVATIVRAMRNFGHPDQRERSLVDINAAIHDTSIIARNELKHVADLDLDLEDIPQILGYASELNQAILNLLVNAAHAIADAKRDGGRRGTIHVRTWADADAVLVRVRDDGCGMSAETRARIFDPFFTTKEVGRGTGQGLTIVYGVVVDKHGGTVDVDSTPGKGTTFTLRFPLPDDDLDRCLSIH